MVIRIYPDNPNPRAITQAVEVLKNDGVIVYPTDSVYAFGCALDSPKAIDRMRAIAGKTGNRFALVCADLSTISSYAHVDTPTFKALKRNLPGPFTVLLQASGKVPNKYLDGKKEVGIRIPDHAIPLALVEALGVPMVTTSVRNTTLEEEYTTDPSLLQERYGAQIDAMIDGGYGGLIPTTVVDFSSGAMELVREGLGEWVE